MKLRNIILGLMVWVALVAASQPAQEQDQWEWYLDEVVAGTFVGRNYFEYYYMPSASEMQQQRAKGEVTYFLNSPDGLNSKKVRDMIDRLMDSYDDIRPVGTWHMTNTTYWKEFRFDSNRFKFSVKRKALDDGTYYVSVTETAGYYKSLGKNKSADAKSAANAPSKRSTRRDRRPVTQQEADAAATTGGDAALLDAEETSQPVVSEKERRRLAREQQEAQAMEERARQRRAQEQRRAEAKAQKEAEKQRKAEEKKKKEEEKRLKREEERQRREQARLEREQQRRQQAAARQQAADPKPVESKYHYTDVALWLSEKYDFTQTAAGQSSCSMYSTVVKDVEMAKLAIKNALKGSNARMAVPWRVNAQTGMVETGYEVDGHVLVFAIGKNDDGNIALDVTEVSAQEFESFKQALGN